MSDSLAVNPLLASAPLNQQKVGRSYSAFGSASVPQMQQPLSSDQFQNNNKSNNTNNDNNDKHHWKAMGIAAIGVLGVIGIAFLCKGKGKAKITPDKPNQEILGQAKATPAKPNQEIPGQPKATPAKPNQEIPGQPETTPAKPNQEIPGQPKATPAPANKSTNAFEASGGFKSGSSAQKLYDTDKKFEKFCRKDFAEKLRLREKYKDAGPDSSLHAPAGVSFEDEAIISYYTADGYRKLNEALRSNKKFPENLEPFRTTLLESLAKMPNNEKGTVYRRITDFDQSEIKDGIYQPKEFLSTTDDSKSNFFCLDDKEGKNPARFIITNAKGQGKKIAHVSMNVEEGEVLFPPNTRFKILSDSRDLSGAKVIEMECLGSAS